MKTLTLKTLFLFAIFCFSITCSVAQETEGTTTFHELTGKVVDSNGKPIEKFSVQITIHDYSKDGWRSAPKTVKKWEGEFEDGEFQFDVDEPIEFTNMTYLSRTVKAEGFLQLGYGSFEPLGTIKGTFATLKLARGIKVKGKVVMPDSQSDEKIVEPKLIVAKKMSSLIPNYNNNFQAAIPLQDDGSFERVVPENCTLMVTASSANAATFYKNFKIPKADSNDSQHDLGELKLKEGVKVTGTVVDRDGNPVEGQIVQILHKTHSSQFSQNEVYGYDTSDAEGKFELPPRAGKCTITVASQANINNKLVKPKGKHLKTKPVKLNLEIGKPTEPIVIRESKTWKIHGIVSFDGDKPSMSHYQPGNQSQTPVTIKDNGEFEYEVVDGTNPYIILYQSMGDRVMLASMTTQSLKQNRKHFSGSPEQEGQFFQLKKVESDIGPLEFKMVEQLVDERSWSERLFDWYYFGD